MTTRTPPRAATPQDGRPSNAALRPLPRSGQRGRLLGGTLLIVVSGALIAWLFVGASHRIQVVVVTRDVPVGSKLTAADLATARVGADASVHVVPASQAGRMVGLYAAVDLRAGTLLAPTQVTTTLSPGQGQQIVSVALKASQLPDVRPGDQVLVVPTPGAGGQDTGGNAGSAAAPLVKEIPAVVDQVAAPDAEGMVRVNLLVSADAGPQVAKQASTGRIALAITSRKG